MNILHSVIELLSPSRNIERLFLAYRYFHCKLSDYIYFVVLPVHAFRSRVHHAIYTDWNLPGSICTPFASGYFYTDKFLLRIITLWDRLSRGCFPCQ